MRSEMAVNETSGIRLSSPALLLLELSDKPEPMD